MSICVLNEGILIFHSVKCQLIFWRKKILGVRPVEEGHKGNLWKRVPWGSTNPLISFV